MIKNPAKGISWDLSDFYTSLDSPQIAKDRKTIEALSSSFVKKYKGNINSKSLKPSFLLAALKDEEKIYKKLTKHTTYFSLMFSKDTSDSKIQKAYQEAMEFSSKISTKLLWFGVEWQHLEETTAQKMINSPILSEYKHSLSHSRAFSKHVLSEPEEKIIQQKNQSGATAFVRLYDQFNSEIRFHISLNGKTHNLTQSEIGVYLGSFPDRKVRQKAAKSYTESFVKNKSVYTFTLNTLLLDKKISDELRGYTYPQEATFLSYEVNKQTVNTMVSSVKDNYPTVERFYKLKSKVTGTKPLHEWDRYSPFLKTKEKTYSWDEAKQIVVSAFSSFSKDFADKAQMFFDNNWIDAELSNGKRSGAFCSYTIPSIHPYILTNFDGTPDAVSTLAHELGHGIHILYAKNNNLSNFYPSTAIAEIASVFAETIVFEYLYNNAKTNKEKAALLGDRLQSIFATVHRQVAFYKFEEDIHLHRRKKGELTSEEFANYYQTRLQKMFGKSLTLTKGHSNWWMPISHFYHYNFYVFTYAFGELLSLSLYAKYKNEGDAFITAYQKALSSGGSRSPADTVKLMSIDISDKNFWNKGLKLIENYVDELESLV